MEVMAVGSRCRGSDSANGMSVVRYLAKMSLAAERSGRSILIFSRAARAEMAGSMRSWRLEAPMTMTFLRPSTPSISCEQLGDDVVSTSEEMPVPRVRRGVHFVEEDDDGHVLAGPFPWPDEDFRRILRSVRDLLV